MYYVELDVGEAAARCKICIDIHRTRIRRAFSPVFTLAIVVADERISSDARPTYCTLFSTVLN